MVQMTTVGTSQSLPAFIVFDGFTALDLAGPSAVATLEHHSHLLAFPVEFVTVHTLIPSGNADIVKITQSDRAEKDRQDYVVRMD